MIQHHKYSLTELENMIPWEREIYISLLLEWIKEEEELLPERLEKAIEAIVSFGLAGITNTMNSFNGK